MRMSSCRGRRAYGYVVEASIGKGRIKSIDTGAAERAPGVMLVLTYRNTPEQGTGNHHVAHPVLTSPEVHILRHAGRVRSGRNFRASQSGRLPRSREL